MFSNVFLYSKRKAKKKKKRTSLIRRIGGGMVCGLNPALSLIRITTEHLYIKLFTHQLQITESAKYSVYR